MSDATKAVFLSYASQDLEAVARLCDALRAVGVEVWFDQNELVGGDAWDAKIRKQIGSCALFVPIISASTQARREGYFRLEWRIAAQRTHMMSESVPFLLPVVIDATRDAEADVPGEFKAVQWSRLRQAYGGQARIDAADSLGVFCARVKKLLDGSELEAGRPRPAVPGAGFAEPTTDPVAAPTSSPKKWLRAVSVIGGLAIGLVYALRPMWSPPPPKETRRSSLPAAATASASMSAARQLAEKARLLLDEIDSTPDDYATAEGLIKRALELDQNDGEIWAISSRINSMYLSRAFDNSDARREPARSQAERALKLAPDSVETLLAVARVNRRGDPERAEAALQKALTLAPRDGRLWLNLGSLYRVQERMDDAMAHYEKAAAFPEVMPLARYDQFLVSFYRKDFSDADRYVREAVAALPTTNIVTGQAMLELTWRGQPEAALRVLAAAPAKVRAEPRSVIVTVLAAQMNRRPEQALAALRRFPADYVNDAWYVGPKALLVGLCEAQANRPEAARVAWESGIALLRKRLQETPNGMVEHLRLGELLAWSGQTEAALLEVKVYEQLTSGRIMDWTLSPARIYAALGRVDEAVPFLARELAAPPSGRWPLTPALLRLDPLWDKLRDDPRFQALCVEPEAKK